MNTFIWMRLALFGFAFAAAAAATRAETTLALDIDFGVRYVPPSRVTVPAKESLKVEAPDFGPVQWFKNGHPVAGATGRTLIIPSVKPSDAGRYEAVYTAPDMAGKGSQLLILYCSGVERLVNLSTRAQVGTGGKTFVAGFVVGGVNEKKIIIRAIGPSLEMFGVSDPVAHPAISIFDSEGNPYTNGYVYAQCAGCPTYESDLAESLTKAGAFPLPPGTDDVVEMRPFAPGAYTVHVTSEDGAPGVALLEIYEVP